MIVEILLLVVIDHAVYNYVFTIKRMFFRIF